MTDFVFIDSGVGGIPYMTTLMQRSPEASCLYVADTANFPYGEKTHEQVIDCVIPLVKKICDKFAPAVIVLACNTISVNALETLRQTFPQNSFVGTVPAIKLAASVSKKRRLGLLATRATCENPYNQELKNKFASDCLLINRGDGQLVSFIEHKGFTCSRQEGLQAVKPAVDFFRTQGCDVIILGCTHFLNFTDIFEEACKPDIKVVDSVDGVVRHALEVRQSIKPSAFGEPVVPDEPLASGNPVAPGEPLASCEPAAPGAPLAPAAVHPSHPAQLYVTSLADAEEEKQYKELSHRFGINFLGKL